MIDSLLIHVVGGASDAPSTAFSCDWNLLTIGQQLWLKWFETLREFPPLQAPESYNLNQVMNQLKKVATHPTEE